MKASCVITLLVFLFSTVSCVQKSYRQTVVVRLSVPGVKDVKTVGIRGNGKPLSWDHDLEMTPIVKDSLYTATVTTVTGYKFAEIKFTVNGEFELADQPNRRIMFSGKDTTFVNAVYNMVQ
jgi:hypothetical protein